MPATSTRYFLSYNKNDRAWAEWIAAQLENAGHTAIYQHRDFPPGCNFEAEIHNALKTTDRTLALLSRTYLESNFTTQEWTAILAADPISKQRRLIPVKVAPCQPDGLLTGIVYIDLTNLTGEDPTRQHLLDQLHPGARPPAAFPGRTSSAFPGNVLWSVPRGRNPHFTGRDDAIAALQTALHSGRPAAITQAIAGLGGVGKTTLAAEYAHRHRAEYPVVWWLRAEQPLLLETDLAALAVAAGVLEPNPSNLPEAARAGLAWLAHQPKWLLVFDNATDAAALQGYRPSAPEGHVLITSRDQHWDAVAESLALPVWTVPQSVAFLRERTGREEPEAAAELARETGGLPLALEHAAAYVRQSAISLAAYVRRFRTNAERLLQTTPRNAEYPEAVAATLGLSIDRLGQEKPGAVDLLNVLAFFAPEPLPRVLLLAWAEDDELRLDETIAALRAYSLLDLSAESGLPELQVHRLAQAVARFRLPAETRKEKAAEAVGLAGKTFGYEEHDLTTWELARQMLPHALAAADFADLLEAAPETTGRVLNETGLFLLDRAALEEAEPRMNRALTIDEKVYGPDHPEVAIDANNLGLILQAKGDLEGAERYAQRALTIDDKVYGPDHPNVARDANNLGQILKEKGDLEGAERYTHRALTIDEKVYGPDHPSVARDANNLGQILQEKGNLEGAERYTHRALTIARRFFPETHPTVRLVAGNLALIQSAGK